MSGKRLPHQTSLVERVRKARQSPSERGVDTGQSGDRTYSNDSDTISAESGVPAGMPVRAGVPITAS